MADAAVSTVATVMMSVVTLSVVGCGWCPAAVTGCWSQTGQSPTWRRFGRRVGARVPARRVPGATSDAELVMSAVTVELMMALGISKGHAEGLQLLATCLVRVLPETLAMVECGRLDLTRARLLAAATEVLDDTHARAVQALVLPKVGAGPWDGPSPRAWRAQIQRAVVTVDPDAARRRRETAIAHRLVRAWAAGDGTGVLQIIAQDTEIAFADGVINKLAQAWPEVGADGEALRMDQRRVDSFMDLLRRVAYGDQLPTVRARGEREVGIVLHGDTFFGDGPGKDDPGELRGLGAPAPVDPRSAAKMARDDIDAGAATRVLLVGGDGVLQRTIRLPEAPPGGWTRDLLEGSVRQAIPDLPPLQTENYEPTVAITEHVRAVHPRCTSYDCARLASRCDLDHDQAYPRGPTCVTNLCPRCRRHHELKTRGLVHTRLHRDGSVTTTTLLGTTITIRPGRLPGHGPGEAYAG
ncbi:MAG: DUF222 domain-containing protein [Sporichthyaceae bacterium]